ncbi:MAG: RDD family protein, partial [Candidatus Saccharimonadales bacterium]
SRRAQSAVAEYVPFMVDPASIDRRVMAFAVDFAAVTAGFLGFLVVFVASTPHLPTGLTAAALAGVVYTALWVLYQMLFFSLSGATAGMLYAHIALCTFDDQNPTRSALQRRLAAWWVSLLPLGIGFLWCFVDEDNLCWHDRITRTYQREY